jgi:hypothetical protein
MPHRLAPYLKSLGDTNALMIRRIEIVRELLQAAAAQAVAAPVKADPPPRDGGRARPPRGPTEFKRLVDAMNQQEMHP